MCVVLCVCECVCVCVCGRVWCVYGVCRVWVCTNDTGCVVCVCYGCVCVVGVLVCVCVCVGVCVCVNGVCVVPLHASMLVYLTNSNTPSKMGVLFIFRNTFSRLNKLTVLDFQDFISIHRILYVASILHVLLFPKLYVAFLICSDHKISDSNPNTLLAQTIFNNLSKHICWVVTLYSN